MKTCKNCNLSFDDDKMFCKKCGKPLISEYQIEPKAVAKKTVLEDKIKADPLNLELLHEYAQFLFVSLIFKDTITVCLKILAINENDGLANELLFKSYFQLKMFQEASEYGQQLLLEKPTDIVLLQALAEIATKSGNLRKETEYYNQILSLQPANTSALLNKALKLLEENQLEKAIEIFSNLNQVGQNDRITTIYTGINKALKADYNGAIKLLSTILSDDEFTKQIDINTNRAILYLVYSLCQSSAGLSEIKPWAAKINHQNLKQNHNPIDEQTNVKITEYIVNQSLNDIIPSENADYQISKITETYLVNANFTVNSNSNIAGLWYAVGNKQAESKILSDAADSFKKASDLMPGENKYKEKYAEYLNLFENDTQKRKRKTIFRIAASIIGLIIIVISIFAYKGFKEKSAFELAKTDNSPSSYQTYLDKYPKGKYYSETLLLLEKASWAFAKTLNTVEGFDKFITLYANSNHFQEANNMKEEALWVFSKNTKNYSNYMQQYPGGKYIKDIRYDVPDIERIKSDLIGKGILGWNFDALSEFKQSNISNTINTPTRIEYQVDFSLEGLNETQADIHEAKIMVTYLLGDNGWYFNDIKALSITFNYSAPLNEWLTITPLQNSTYSILSNRQRFWVRDGSYDRNYKAGGNDADSFHLTSSQIHISSRESQPVNIVIRYTPSN